MEPVSCIPNLCSCPIAQQRLNLQAQIRAVIIDHSLIASVAVLLQLEHMSVLIAFLMQKRFALKLYLSSRIIIATSFRPEDCKLK